MPFLKELVDIYGSYDELVEELNSQDNVEYGGCPASSGLKLIDGACDDIESVDATIQEIDAIELTNVDDCQLIYDSMVSGLSIKLKEESDKSIIEPLSKTLTWIITSFINSIYSINSKKSYELYDSGFVESVEFNIVSEINDYVKQITDSHQKPLIVKSMSRGDNELLTSFLMPLVSSSIESHELSVDGFGDLIVNAYKDFDVRQETIVASIKVIINQIYGLIIDGKSKLEYDYDISEFIEVANWKSIEFVKTYISSKLGDCYKESHPIEIDENLGHNHQITSGPSFLDLSWWLKFCSILTVVGLSPNYWTTGLTVPSPTGLAPIKLPIVWIPLSVFYTPPILTVITLTINGLVIFPCVFNIRFQPAADSESFHALLFRGANVSIKTKTGGQFNVNYNLGIDETPEKSRKSANVSDDLPTYERLSFNNPNLIKFCKKWLSKAKPHMGLPI